jgi:tol-pal system protein YbgF
MVQTKLIDLIESMSTVMEKDRARIRMLELEVARLRGVLEGQGVYMRPGPALDPTYQAPAPSPPAPGSQFPVTAPPPRDGQSEGPGPADVTRVSDQYAAALTLFQEGQYQRAESAFDELRKTASWSQYAPNFEYWMGESQYALQKYDAALATFHRVVANYPQSTKVDDAQFKIAETHEKLGRKTTARAAYERLVMSYPESEYVGRAQEKLSKLKP